MTKVVIKQQNYFLSHSVGLPFAGMEAYFSQHYFAHWHEENEPWPKWIEGIDTFREQLAVLLNANIDELCPQSNLSSGLTKLIHSLPRPIANKNIILCSAQDFPSMAFVLDKAKTLGYQLELIPEGEDLQDMMIWQKYLSEQVAICLITHVQSNNGQQLPVKTIIDTCHSNNSLTIVDVAQSIGLFCIDTKQWDADFILGSCVKWLCGGPGASFLWVNSKNIERCEPVDVGWFSHKNPFEFDIRHFNYVNNALKFWGGTPTVAPFIHASFAIGRINDIGVSNLRATNFNFLQQIHKAVSKVNPHYIKSPIHQNECSGTAIIHFEEKQHLLVQRLKEANIAFDERELGIRLSPHHYTTQDEMDHLVRCFDYF